MKLYTDAFAQDLFMYNISGRDAYAPMLAAAADRERYLNAILRQFHLQELVD